MRHLVAGSLALVVAPPPGPAGPQLLGELPSRASAVAIRLIVGHATLQLPLPTAAAFRKLAELSLANVAFARGQGGRLGGLLSSACCSRLRRLSLEVLSGLPELRLEADALESLQLAFLLDLRRLHVDAGRLRVLHIRGCFIWTEETARAGSLATIRAPALEELACPRTRGTELVELDGCTSVRLLGKVRGGHGRPARGPRARVLHPISIGARHGPPNGLACQAFDHMPLRQQLVAHMNFYCLQLVAHMNFYCLLVGFYAEKILFSARASSLLFLSMIFVSKH